MSFEDGEKFNCGGCVEVYPIEDDFFLNVNRYCHRFPEKSWLLASTAWEFHFLGSFYLVSKLLQKLFIMMPKENFAPTGNLGEDYENVENNKYTEKLVIVYCFCIESIRLLRLLKKTPRRLQGETNEIFGQFLVRSYYSALLESGYYYDPFELLNCKLYKPENDFAYYKLDFGILNIGDKIRLTLDPNVRYRPCDEYQFLIDYLDKYKVRLWQRILIEFRKSIQTKYNYNKR